MLLLIHQSPLPVIIFKCFIIQTSMFFPFCLLQILFSDGLLTYFVISKSSFRNTFFKYIFTFLWSMKFKLKSTLLSSNIFRISVIKPSQPFLSSVPENQLGIGIFLIAEISFIFIPSTEIDSNLSE